MCCFDSAVLVTHRPYRPPRAMTSKLLYPQHWNAPRVALCCQWVPAAGSNGRARTTSRIFPGGAGPQNNKAALIFNDPTVHNIPYLTIPYHTTTHRPGPARIIPQDCFLIRGEQPPPSPGRGKRTKSPRAGGDHFRPSTTAKL